MTAQLRRRHNPLRLLLLLSALLLAVLPLHVAHGAGRMSISAVTSVDAADADYALVGEFTGTVSTESPETSRLALQIVADGSGNFEAAQYVGGLPGETGTEQPPAIRLVGRRNDDLLVLSGGPYAVLAQPDHCLVVDRDGKYLGRLDRVRRQSPTLGAAPPPDAIVLFDGDGVKQFSRARVTEDGLLAEGADLRPMFQDFNLHAEFMLPYMPAARDQARGNSGIYLQSRYELQILDSFGLTPVNNGCGSVYTVRPPDVNMCLPPLVWQTYDVVFTSPRWASDGTKLKNARLSVWQNGVQIHNDVELANKTGLGQPEAPTLLPILLQDHTNPVRFRNLWIIDRGATPPTMFPAPAEAAAEKEPVNATDEEPVNATSEEPVNVATEEPADAAGTETDQP